MLPLLLLLSLFMMGFAVATGCFRVAAVKNIEASFIFLLARSSASLVACENELSLTRSLNFRSFVTISAVNRENRLWGRKRHSFVNLKVAAVASNAFFALPL